MHKCICELSLYLSTMTIVCMQWFDGEFFFVFGIDNRCFIIARQYWIIFDVFEIVRIVDNNSRHQFLCSKNINNTYKSQTTSIHTSKSIRIHFRFSHFYRQKRDARSLNEMKDRNAYALRLPTSSFFRQYLSESHYISFDNIDCLSLLLLL